MSRGTGAENSPKWTVIIPFAPDNKFSPAQLVAFTFILGEPISCFQAGEPDVTKSGIRLTSFLLNLRQAAGGYVLDEAADAAVGVLTGRLGNWHPRLDRERTPAQVRGSVTLESSVAVSVRDAVTGKVVQLLEDTSGNHGSAELGLATGLLAICSVGPSGGTVVATGTIDPTGGIGAVERVDQKLTAVLDAAKNGQIPCGTQIFVCVDNDMVKLGSVWRAQCDQVGLKLCGVSRFSEVANHLELEPLARVLPADRELIRARRWTRSLTSGGVACVAFFLALWSLIVWQQNQPIEISDVSMTVPLVGGDTVSLPPVFFYDSLVDQVYRNPREPCLNGSNNAIPAEHHYNISLRFTGNQRDDQLAAAETHLFGLFRSRFYPAFVVLEHRNSSDDHAVKVLVFSRSELDHRRPDLMPGETWSQPFNLDDKTGEWITVFAVAQRWSAIDGNALKAELGAGTDKADFQTISTFLNQKFSGRVKKIITFVTKEKGFCQ